MYYWVDLQYSYIIMFLHNLGNICNYYWILADKGCSPKLQLTVWGIPWSEATLDFYTCTVCQDFHFPEVCVCGHSPLKKHSKSQTQCDH